jgi:hypothetical protein
MDSEQKDRVEAAIRYSKIGVRLRNLLFSSLGGIGAVAVLKDAPVEELRAAFVQHFGFPFGTLVMALTCSLALEFLAGRRANMPAEGKPIAPRSITSLRQIAWVTYISILGGIIGLVFVMDSLIGLP